MPSKTQFYAQLAAETARGLTDSLQTWTAFLETSARLYKYPYYEQLLIFAQKPEATACAGYEVWNETMNRYVRRGTKGIALIDSSGDTPRMKYVFDVSDTGGGANARRPFLWEYRPEHLDAVTAALENRFGKSGRVSLAFQLEDIAGDLIESWLDEHQRDLSGIVDGSFLEEYDEDNLRAVFKHAGAVSAAYMMMSRCGLDPSNYFTHEDFQPIFDFNTADTVGVLGTAISETSEQVLRQIEVTIKRYEREHRAERTENHERTELQGERGLSDPGSEPERDSGDAAGQVRQDAEDLSEGTSPGAVLESAPVGEAVSPSEGDRRDGAEPSGNDAAEADGSSGDQREAESRGPDAVGRADEQLQGPGRGDDPPGAGVQLNDVDEGPGQMSLFPSEAEQIQTIAEAESAQQAPSAFSIPQEDIDLLLIFGSNDREAHMKITTEFCKHKRPERVVDFLKKTFRGAYGIETERGKLSSFAAEDGIHIARGDGAEYARDAQVLSWLDAATRIGQLLDEGRYATNVELAERRGFELSQLAQSLLYLYHDLSEEADDAGYLSDLKPHLRSSYTDAIPTTAKALGDWESRQQILTSFREFVEAWKQDHTLLRFRYHRPAELLQGIEDLDLPYSSYETEMRELPKVRHFITEDDINDYLRNRHPYQGGKGRIYDYWQEPHTPKEKADFLKKEYGIGGSNNAFSHNFHADEDHSGKGIRLRKPDCGDVLMTWPQVVKRIDKLMAQDRYLSAEEKAKRNALKEEQQAPEIPADVIEYNSIKETHADELVLFQRGDFFELYGEDAHAASELAQLAITAREIPGVGIVDMVGFPAHALEPYSEVLRDKYDLAIASTAEGGTHEVQRVYSIDHEAAYAIDAHEAEFGADGARAFGPYPPLRIATEEDLTAAVQAWNGDMASKRRVSRYMQEHGRELGADRWLRDEYGGELDAFPVSMSGLEQTELSWRDVQRRIVTLLKKDRFFTDQELDNFEDIDPAEVRERLAEAGIVNGEVVDPAALDADPFIQQVMADADRTAEEEARQLTDTEYAERHMIPGETFFEHDGRQYRIDSVIPETGAVYYQDIGPGPSVDGMDMYLDSITNVRKYMEYGDGPTFVTPGGTVFRIGDDFDARSAGDEIIVRIHLESVNEEDVTYSFPDGPEQEPVAMSRQEFDHYVDEGRFSPVQPEVQAVDNSLTLTLSDGSTYHVGDTVTIGGTAFNITAIGAFDVQLLDPKQNYPIFRAESRESFEQLMLREKERKEPRAETVAFYPAVENGLPYSIEIQTLHFDEPEPEPPAPTPPSENFRITDVHLGEGGPKAKFRVNMDAIYTLKTIERENRSATPEEQETLSRYVGWGGLADAFDKDKREWSGEYKELEAALTPEEYAAARGSTLNAHYTSPTVIKAIYDALANMGFQTGNILEPAMGVGNFFGMLPESMRDSRLYGVELDSISGRIAQQLYPKANITVAGFETTNRKDFFDVAIGNVPFGQYQVNDRAYNKLGFSIHNYFFAKALDQVRPGGVVAFVTSRYTMDAKSPEVRRYLAQRAELLGAIRLPNNAFKANAGTDVVSDIIFLQKRETPIVTEPDWVHLAQNDDGFAINSYFVEHPEMILGRPSAESTQYGRQGFTVEPIEALELADQLEDAIKYIRGTYTEAELPDLGEGEQIRDTIPADPDVKNYSFTVVYGEVYYRENSVMVRPDMNATAKERVKGMVALRNCVGELIDLQMDDWIPEWRIEEKQGELNRLYDAFTAKYGLINDRANRLAFADDSSYYLLCSLEVLDEENKLERKADMFSKRTIKQQRSVTHVDTAVEALTVSIGEKAGVDLGFMASLMGGSEKIPQIVEDLRGIIFKDPSTGPYDLEDGGSHWDKGWQTADEYLSGNVRKKLREAKRAAEQDAFFQPNVAALEQAQPKDLDASEIEVRVGSTWIDKEIFQQFMHETFRTPFYMTRMIQVEYSPVTSEWHITGKNAPRGSDVAAYATYGTLRANAYEILEDTLNLRDVRIYDTVEDADGKQRRVLNSKETTLAAQKQQAIKDAFQDWIWKDPQRREKLVKQYNELMNSTRPREYDGSHLVFAGMNPEITLREHQKNAIAHVIYGGNTMLAHEVGAGKTFEMVAAAMESKRLGLCSKSIFVVPNHLTDQWASEFLRLYPSANILVTTKKDFEPKARKKFCSRIATGDYDAVIIGHSQFEKIPISKERQQRILEEQIADIEAGIEELSWQRDEKFSIKQLEKTKKSLQARLEKLQADEKKDDVITFEQLGVDRMFVDESDNYKNLFLYTKMRNVAGLSTTDAQKSSDMFAKCRYMDELTGGRGIIFATGTPISNSMTELYTLQRYLQYDRLQELGMSHFDCWASRFGETTTALELAPEGTGYRARTRFAKFFNLPELMTLFKEVADIKTADQLDLPTPKVEYHNHASKPTEIQKELVKKLSERATEVHKGSVDSSVDNMLKITSDGRKLGLDQRIINPLLPDEEGTKVNQCVRNILQYWRDGEDKKLTQLVFCDLSTPKAKKAKPPRSTLDSPEIHALEDMIPLDAPKPDFTIYEDIRQKLIAGGMPPEQIAFIHEADTEAKKRDLFAKVRSGQVRVLMGSTAKMGAGTNVQDRLIALHDLDAPWRPRDLTQRKGRIERQGNQNETVHVCRYVTEGTFDAYLWQTLETKQRFISQIMTSKSPVRSCEDVDETALSFAEVKALCAGDPRIKERMDLDVDVSKLKLLKADHQSKQFRLEDQILKFFPQKIEESKGFIRGFEADLKTLAEHPLPKEGFVGMEIRGDKLTDKENAGAALIDAVTDVKSTDAIEIGHYRGFTMTAELSAFGQYTLRLCGEMTHSIDLGSDPRGNLVRIENVLENIPERMRATQAQLETFIQQQEAAKAEVGKPFPQEQELRDKTARLVELDMELNLDGHDQAQPVQESEDVARFVRPSVLDKLKRPPINTTGERKTTHEMEGR